MSSKLTDLQGRIERCHGSEGAPAAKSSLLLSGAIAMLSFGLHNGIKGEPALD